MTMPTLRVLACLIAVIASGCSAPHLSTLPDRFEVQDDRILGLWRHVDADDDLRRVTHDGDAYLLRMDARGNVFRSLEVDYPDWMTWEQIDEVHAAVSDAMEPLVGRHELRLFSVDGTLVTAHTAPEELMGFLVQEYGLVVVPVHQFGILEFEGDDRISWSWIDREWMNIAMDEEGWSSFRHSEDLRLMTTDAEGTLALLRHVIENRDAALSDPHVHVRVNEDAEGVD